MDERLSRIADKLQRIRRRWFRRRSFGEEAHRFHLRPPISEPALTRFEAENRVGLPEEYRRFLLCLGNGGAGPGYGLMPLETSARWRSLAQPCPLRPDVSPTDDWLEASGCSDDYPGMIQLCDFGCADYTTLVVCGPARGRVVRICWDAAPPGFAPDPDFLAWYERWLDWALQPGTLRKIAWYGTKVAWYG
jgi:hypothetical protein